MGTGMVSEIISVRSKRVVVGSGDESFLALRAGEMDGKGGWSRRQCSWLGAYQPPDGATRLIHVGRP